ncbi:MAG: hypothetical protein Q4A90_04305 [Streptococcus sp.]|nr:hypothetical protein [Streptococcus sp.]
MIDTLKMWIETIKSSPVAKPFLLTKRWFQDNVIKRKLVIFSVLFIAWFSLLFGAIYSPQRQTYTDEQLKPKQSFVNGTGEIKLTSQTYSPKTGIIVLQFETKDATSSIARGIDAKRLKWKLYSRNKSNKMVMEVVPILDNKISVIIRAVPENFDALAIDVVNTTVSTSSIDIDITEPSSDNKLTSKSLSSKEEAEEKTVQFFITTQNKNLKQKTINTVTREEFTLSEIEEEKEYQEGQIKKLNDSISKLKLSIEDDESRKEGLVREAQYLTGDDLEANQKDISVIDSNIETKNRSIEIATENIEKVRLKIDTLDKKKVAVKDGTFEFSNSIETIEMK